MKTKLKDNKIFRWTIIPLCIILCFIGQFIPSVNGFSSDAFGVLFIFLGVLILWLTIGIDWPSLLCIFALGFIPSLGFKNVLSSSFGNSTFVFLLFTFICTYALSQTSLIRIVAIGFVNSKLAKKNGYCFMFLFLLSVLLLGMFISPTVLFVVMLPILNEILEVSKIEKDDKIGKVMMLGLGFTVSISSGMTPIAHVFPILAMNAAQIEISPLAYMGIAVPVGLILFLAMYGIFILFIRPDVSKFKDADVRSLKDGLPKISKKDIYVLSIFVIVILLWIIPSLFKGVSKEFYDAINKYGTAMPPILGTIALCIIRVDDKPIVKIEEAFKNGVPWGSLIMCVATLALGSALTNDGVGIKQFLQNSLGSSLASFPSIVLLIIFTSWAALQTNLSSNMVTATLVATAASSILGSIATDINVASIICIIGMLASFAFATPPSMPHIAIISGSESCNTKDVLIYGTIMMALSVVVALLVGYPLGILIL